LKNNSSNIVGTVGNSKSCPSDVGNPKGYPQNGSIHNKILNSAKNLPLLIRFH